VLAAGLAVVATGCSSASSSSSAPSASAADTGSASAAPSASGGDTAAPSASDVRAYDPAHAGGDVTLLAKAAGGSIDPKVNYTLQYWQLFQATYDGLMAFRKVDGEGSFKVVPDLAEAAPTISADGKTYEFTLRKGIMFSDGAEVTVDDVQASFQRIFKVSSPTAGTFYNGILGADECIKTPDTCTLKDGVIVDKASNKVTIKLKGADPEFLYKLSVPHASINPKSAPSKDAGTTPFPGTGAYYFKSYDTNKALVMERNPHFKEWSREAQPQGYPDTITEKFGLPVESAVTAVQNGQADWVFDPLPADRLNEVGTKFAEQVHVNTLTAYWYLPMNVNIAPFNNVKARQAVNWALDRNALVKVFGGANLASPVCTILPPGFPGHVDDCQYTNPAGTTWQGPDLEKAKALVQESGTAGQEVAIVVSDDEVNKSMGEAIQSTLNQIGYKATVKPISGNIQFTYIQNSKNKVQISVTQWYQDYPAASDFLNVLLSCASFVPGSDSSINMSGYCNKDLDAKMAAALELGRTDQEAANKQWAEIDKAMMTESPQAPIFTPKLIDFVSKRVGNYQFSKQFYMLVSQLWVK